MSYTPDTVLLNNVYIPFSNSEKLQVFNCKDHFTSFEIGSNGVSSIIPLNLESDGEKEAVYPFINMSRYDSESKSWFWYDSNNFPFRLGYYNRLYWKLRSVWDVGPNKDLTLNFIPQALNFSNDNIQLGFYSNAVNHTGIKMYPGYPMIMTIDDRIITDKTDYTSGSNPELTNFKTDLNREFYYDVNLNKIVTNQNLDAVAPESIKIYCYTISNAITVKCRLASNCGENAFLTPMVDYFVVKLNGQFLKG
jgi:hypothetical protein